jgi:hypothetical protein
VPVLRALSNEKRAKKLDFFRGAPPRAVGCARLARGARRLAVESCRDVDACANKATRAVQFLLASAPRFVSHCFSLPRALSARGAGTRPR